VISVVTGGASLLDLPVEIRLSIYSLLFRPSKVTLDAGNPPANQSCLIPAAAYIRKQQCARSSQLLRVCKEILHESRPVLYANTTFHVTTHTFTGNLPSSLSNGNPIAKHARHVVWQLECDILKRYYPEDFAFEQGDMEMLISLEINAKVDTWKDSFCGEDCDRDCFVRGGRACSSMASCSWASCRWIVLAQRYLLRIRDSWGKER
jgi:hypothetical protein